MLGLLSCSSTTPSGFWDDFKKEALTKNISDQGLHGGHRAIYWKSQKKGAFHSKEIVDFATRNGWQLTDSLEVKSEDLETWNYNQSPIFPLSHTGFFLSPEMSNPVYKYFPRWINDTTLKVYMFKTGWITIEPGTNDTIDENGFVVLNNDRDEMSVYHLWGE